MSDTRTTRKEQIASEFARRFDVLWQMSYEQLATLPESHTDTVIVSENKVQFTTFREPRNNGGLLIVLRSDESLFLGMTAGGQRGLLVSPSGEKSEAPDKELWSY